MNHKQVVEAWRHNTRERATGSNVYFEGRTIYSYGSHFPMAYLSGYGIVLVNSDSYSNSTSRHQSYVNGAIYNEQKIEVSTEILKDMIYQFEHTNEGLSPRTVERAREEIRARIDNATTKLLKARVEWSISRWRRDVEENNEQLILLQQLPVSNGAQESSYPL